MMAAARRLRSMHWILAGVMIAGAAMVGDREVGASARAWSHRRATYATGSTPVAAVARRWESIGASRYGERSDTAGVADPARLNIAWSNNMLSIRGEDLPGGEINVWYLEAYCRPGSTDRDWRETVIGHKTELVEAAGGGQLVRLRCKLNDGVIVNHEIRAGADEVDFQVVAHNPTEQRSDAHWVQPCLRVDKFTGVAAARASEAYLPKSFIFVNGQLRRLPTEPWATQARYTPGQVWCPKGVDRNDVNPRPLSAIVPSNGLIGCFSADETRILATAWEPYQELFQGVIVCLHSDFRLGGLAPGETKRARGKIYIVDADVAKLAARYAKDFPEQAGGGAR